MLRGIEKNHVERFFDPQYGKDIHNPFELYGMQDAVERIAHAVRRKERILVHGDYDVDGISSTAILVTALQAAGAHVIPYLPHRIENGYGISQETLRHLEPEIDLLITVDCGISNAEEITWLKSRGKDAIIVDHHEIPQELPPALAILHPRHPKGSYPWGYLSGAGVAWKFAQAILRTIPTQDEQSENKEKWLLDLALLGTVGDVVPLLNENRAIVRFGMHILARTPRPGIRALMKVARISPHPRIEDISHRLIPLINAAGRMDHPQPALDTLLATNESDAARYAERLYELNQLRRTHTQHMLSQARTLINPELPFVFAADISWSPGLVGLVAGRLADEYARPAIVVGGNGRHAVGSARAGGKTHVLDLLSGAHQQLLKLGGHAGAAGFSLLKENIEQFQEALLASASGIDESATRKANTADAVLSENLIHWDTVELLEKFEPFGEANPKPAFIWKRLALLDCRKVGKREDHLKMRFAVEEREVDAIGFGLGKSDAKLGKYMDVLGTVDVNEFRGSTTLQLNVKDVAPAGTVDIAGSPV